MSKKITLEEANEILKKKNIRISGYNGLAKPVNAECLICGHKWTTRGNVILRLQCGCPKCQKENASKKMRFTKEDFLKKYNLTEKFEIIGDYKNVVTKTSFKCKICGFERVTDPNTVIKFPGCPNCNGTRRLTEKEYIERINNTHSEKYTLLSKYESISKKVHIRHEKCGKDFWTNALNFVGTGKKEACNCPFCSHGSKLRTQDEFETIVKEKTNSRFTVNSKYKGNLKSIELKCSCGTIVKKTPYYFTTHEILCPKCDSKKIYMSKGERKINDYLYNNKIDFESQKKFKKCKDKKLLPFDFLVKLRNKEFLIEYDGIQHYEYKEKRIFNYEKFLIIKKHDEIKNNFCKENNITLIRIPYWDFDNIEKILDNLILNQRSTTIENTSNDGSE